MDIKVKLTQSDALPSKSLMDFWKIADTDHPDAPDALKLKATLIAAALYLLVRDGYLVVERDMGTGQFAVQQVNPDWALILIKNEKTGESFRVRIHLETGTDPIRGSVETN